MVVCIGQSRWIAFLLGAVIVWLLYRNITSLGRITMTVWAGVMAVIAWIMVEGALRFDAETEFSFTGAAAHLPPKFGMQVGAGMILAIYAYLGYYTVCYVGDEVKEPGRTIPRSIF